MIHYHMNRTDIARDTLRILDEGRYTAVSGVEVELASHRDECARNTRYYLPLELDHLKGKVLSERAPFPATTFSVTDETTLAASERLAGELAGERIGVLNFASARNPGGGFLRGAHAQEESLARSSALYPSLLTCSDFYETHRAGRSLLYTDRVIYSPGCAVFRRDDGALLDAPYRVDILTSPAPNAGAIRTNQPEDEPRIESVLRRRAGKVLAVAAANACTALVLGAWGCGVFRNDPAQVATIFREELGPDGPFWGRFRHVLFAVMDGSTERTNLRPFMELFGGIAHEGNVGDI